MSFDLAKFNKIYKNFDVCLEFNFFSYFSIEKTKKELTDLLGKSIDFDNQSEFESKQYNYIVHYNEDFKFPQIKLKTSLLNHQDGRLVLIKIFEWIKKNGYTESYSNLNVSLYDSRGRRMIPTITKLDKLKIILEINEDLIYSKITPGGPHRRSVKFIEPITSNFISNGKIIKENYKLPNYKNSSIDIESDCVTFKYIGGEYYEKKINESLDIYNYYFLTVFTSLIESNYSEKNINELNMILDDYKSTYAIYNDPSCIKEHYPKLDVLCNLSRNEQTLKSYWPKFRDKILELLLHSNLNKAIINYDSELSRVQVKDASFEAHDLEGFEFVECSISNGYATNCHFYNCKINECFIKNSNLILDTVAKTSNIQDCYINKSSELFDCYVYGKFTGMQGKMSGGILKQDGNIMGFADIENNVKKV